MIIIIYSSARLQNLEAKKINDEKKAALAAQFAAEATLRRVHAAQKDDDMPPIEAILAPLEAELKLARHEVLDPKHIVALYLFFPVMIIDQCASCICICVKCLLWVSYRPLSKLYSSCSQKVFQLYKRRMLVNSFYPTPPTYFLSLSW